MLVIVAAALAAAVSWLGNKLLTMLWRAQGIIFFTPLLEEGTKTLAAVGLGQSVVLVHGTFGLIEAFYDIYTSKKNGPLAAVAGLVSHLFYGILTMIVISQWGLFEGILSAYLTHTLWNAFIIKLPQIKKF